jgi:hypothetical protein
MFEFESQENWSASFKLATNSLRASEIRSELDVHQIAAPKDLAANAIAICGTVLSGDAHAGDAGEGRIVFLKDDKEVEAWGGSSRVICFIKSPLEPHIASDERLAEIAWNWLSEALRQRGADYFAEAGTATRIHSTGFGGLAKDPDHAEIEIRASWSPRGDSLRPHLEAFQDLICMVSGLPYLPAGVHGIGR